MELFYIDGNIDYFECGDEASKQIDGAFIVGAENGPTEAIKDFLGIIKKDPDTKIITNCLAVLAVALYNEEAYKCVFHILKERNFCPLFNVYPELKNADKHLIDLYLSKMLEIKNIEKEG